MSAPVDDGHCFACGPYNDRGLHLRFSPDGDGTGEGAVVTRIVLPSHLQGWRAIAHGGVVMMLLDEAMAHAAGAVGLRGLTAQMSMRFRKPVPLETTIVVRGNVRWTRRNVVALEATVCDEDGTVLATGEGSFVSAGSMNDKRLGVPDVVTAED